VELHDQWRRAGPSAGNAQEIGTVPVLVPELDLDRAFGELLRPGHGSERSTRREPSSAGYLPAGFDLTAAMPAINARRPNSN